MSGEKESSSQRKLQGRNSVETSTVKRQDRSSPTLEASTYHCEAPTDGSRNKCCRAIACTHVGIYVEYPCI